MHAMFLLVAGEISILSKTTESGKVVSIYIIWSFYFTTLNLGALKNIILRLNNNIETVRTGKI